LWLSQNLILFSPKAGHIFTHSDKSYLIIIPEFQIQIFDPTMLEIIIKIPSKDISERIELGS